MKKGKYFWAVVARQAGGCTGINMPILTMNKWGPLAIYPTKEIAILAREDRYTFRNQMEYETKIRRVRVI